MSDPRADEALVEMMFLAVHADGEFGDEERNAFARAVREHAKIPDASFKSLIERIEKDLAKEGRTARISALKSAFPDARAREGALTEVVRMVAADGIVRTSERELILEVAEGLGIDGDRAADIVQSVRR